MIILLEIKRKKKTLSNKSFYVVLSKNTNNLNDTNPIKTDVIKEINIIIAP